MTTYDIETIRFAKAHLNTNPEKGFHSDVNASNDDAEQLLFSGWKPNIRSTIVPCPKCKEPMEYGDVPAEECICMVCVNRNS